MDVRGRPVRCGQVNVLVLASVETPTSFLLTFTRLSLVNKEKIIQLSALNAKTVSTPVESGALGTDVYLLFSGQSLPAQL